MRNVFVILLLIIATGLMSQINLDPWADLQESVKQVGKAEYDLGVMYETGSGGTIDTVKAVEHYRASAESSYGKGQFKMGALYYTGRYVKKDIKEAVKYFKLSAENGLAEGQYAYGYMLESGEGVEQDLGKAVDWYHLAANQNYTDAQYNLGVIYYQNGEDVTYFADSYFWLYILKERGQETNEKVMSHIEENLTPELILQIKTEADLWLANHY